MINLKVTEKQWFEHPSFRNDLEILLSNPVMQIAFEIVQNTGLKSTDFPPVVDLRDYFGLMGAKKDGYFEALKNLVQLSKVKVTRTPEREPFKTPPDSKPTQPAT